LYEVEGWGLKLDVRSYRHAIIACNQAEHEYQRSLRRPSGEKRERRNKHHEFEWWECAISLLRRMKESGLKPDTPTLSSTISACEAAGQWQRALGILQCAMNDDVDDALNLYCFNAAIAACEKGSAWVEALEIYEKMKDQGGLELRPNLVTVSSLVLALDNAGQKEFAVSIYREGIRKRFIQSPWRFTKDSSSGVPIRAIDLHSYSAAMTRATIRNYMNYSLLSKSLESPEILSDLTIIVGQGWRSMEGPVLKETVLHLLQVEYGIDAVVDDHNPGRVVITSNHLRRFLAKRNWYG
jgi:hypothetical protein